MTPGCRDGDNTVAEWVDNAPSTPNSAAGPAQPPVPCIPQGREHIPLASWPTSHWGNWDFPQKPVSLPITTWDAFPSWEMGAAPKFGTSRVLTQASPAFECPCRKDEDFQIKILGENPTQHHPCLVTGLAGTPGERGGDGAWPGWARGPQLLGTVPAPCELLARSQALQHRPRDVPT